MSLCFARAIDGCDIGEGGNFAPVAAAV